MFLFFGKPSFCQNEQISDVENPCWLMSAHSYTMQYIYIHLDRDIHITYYIFITYWGVSSSINWESLSEPSSISWFLTFWRLKFWTLRWNTEITKVSVIRIWSCGFIGKYDTPMFIHFFLRQLPFKSHARLPCCWLYVSLYLKFISHYIIFIYIFPLHYCSLVKPH